MQGHGVHTPLNIAAHMRRAGLAFGERPAVATGTCTLYSYRELAERVARVAAALRGRFALHRGDRVAIALKNCPAYLEILYGCWHAGLVAVPLNCKLHHTEISYILADCGARLCFTSSDLVLEPGSLSGAGALRVVEVDGADYARIFADDTLPLVDSAPDDPAWLFYTSGTTGRPKGAVLSHRNLLAMSHCYFADVDRQGPWRTLLHAAPMSHGSGLYALPHVMQGCCHVIPDTGGFDPEEIFQLIGHWPATVFFAAPTMIWRLLQHPHHHPTDGLKTIIYGGGPMYLRDLLEGIERFGFKFAQLYGQGESPMTITALSAEVIADNKHPRWYERLASVGIAQSAVEVRVVDETNRELPAGTIGEVLVRGATVMSGYWNNAKATADALRQGWLHTGDLGCFDQDGFLTLKDRCKDLIISGGSNIYPREVEEVLLRHPDIAEASVIGRPDREWGETVVAYVVPRGSDVLSLQVIDDFCTKHMARFKRPRHYRIVASLPKNSAGKVLKKELRETERNHLE